MFLRAYSEDSNNRACTIINFPPIFRHARPYCKHARLFFFKFFFGKVFFLEVFFSAKVHELQRDFFWNKLFFGKAHELRARGVVLMNMTCILSYVIHFRLSGRE